MCGITGICSNDIDPQTIRLMTDQLGHRGPDASGIYINESKTIALGHTRLSVIDLSENANQPMSTPDGRYIIVFNGEIYNFKEIRKEILKADPTVNFNTQSDTETILHAYKLWQNEMALKLEGMFAIALYDNLKNSLFLCRDRAGKKPLFYYQDERHFIFASEIKALLKYPLLAGNNKLDRNAINYFLHLGYIPEPLTIYSSVKKFPAGHYGYMSAPRFLELHSWWKANDYLSKRKFNSDMDAISELRNSLFIAVEQRLISDVPLGTFLSGGTDSSLVTAIASRLSSGRIKTFCIGFKENKYDESAYAGKVARHLNTDHQEYILSEKEAIGILETYLTHFDEPFADTSAIPTMLVSKLARKEVTVALTGDGGDELFQGYGAYRWANRLDNKFLRAFQNPLSFILKSTGNSRYNRISHMLEKVKDSQLRSHIFSQEQYFFTQDEIKNKLLQSKAGPDFEYFDPEVPGLKPAEKQALFDIQYYLKDDLLVKVDRASMYHSLECRCPLLDHKIIEFALSLPYHFKKRGNVSKWILKEILRNFLSPDLIYRPKWGFSIPLLKWMKNDLQYLIHDHLNKESIENAGLVKFAYVDDLKKSFREGNDYLYNRLWILIVIHRWIRNNAA